MIPLFESQTGWVASGLPVPAVVKDHPSGFWVFAPGGKDRYSPEHFSTFLDLSPLQKFMGRRINWGQRTRDSRGWNIFRDRLRNGGIVGIDYSFDWVPPAPSPEKSPQERALDDFIAKRKAKRDCGGHHDQDAMERLIAQDAKDAETERTLDRAMRRLSFHEQDIHTRLMPYRREE